METWSIRQVARAAGRSVGHAAGMATAGLLPGYATQERVSADIPADLASDLALVLRHATPRRLATLLQADPDVVDDVAAALSRLAAAARSARVTEEAA